MGTTTFNGPARSEKGFQVATKNTTTGAVTTRYSSQLPDLTGLSLKNIGLELGKRDHSTVIHACKIITNKINSVSSFNKLIKKYKRDLKKYSIS